MEGMSAEHAGPVTSLPAVGLRLSPAVAARMQTSSATGIRTHSCFLSVLCVLGIRSVNPVAVGATASILASMFFTGLLCLKKRDSIVSLIISVVKAGVIVLAVDPPTAPALLRLPHTPVSRVLPSFLVSM